jgi:hypothetical protein
MTYLNHDDAAMTAVFKEARTIAVVGHSDKAHRTSYQIARFLRQAGYHVLPVNPEAKSIDGMHCYAALEDIDVPVDIVNVFRRSEFLPEIVSEAIAIRAKAVWAQLGVESETALNRALSAGLAIAMNRCIKVELMRLDIGHER